MVLERLPSGEYFLSLIEVLVRAGRYIIKVQAFVEALVLTVRRVAFSFVVVYNG
jgi:hypothetical protein